MKTDIKKLVISQPLAVKLMLTGLNNSAMFHWFDRTEDTITWNEGDPRERDCGLLYNPSEDTLPAWTYEEIRIMIGNDHNAPDLREPRPKPMRDEDITFIAYYPHEAKNFDSGAEAAGEYLVWLIENKHVAPADANERYTRKFNPQ